MDKVLKPQLSDSKFKEQIKKEYHIFDCKYMRKSETKVINNHGIELRQLAHGKYCHCLIPNSFTGGEKCIHCERIFHNYPLQENKFVSLSIMTYVELYDIIDVCYHVTIDLHSKACSCIKISEDNTDSVICLSESLSDILTSQGNIDELFRGKLIKEMENCLYDGNHYYYIIQQGKNFHRGAVACSYVDFWPLFASITKELYPNMEPRMMF